MSLFWTSAVLLLSVVSAYVGHSRIENNFNNEYINSAEEIPASSDKCLVSRDSLIRALEGVIALINQLQNVGQLTIEQGGQVTREQETGQVLTEQRGQEANERAASKERLVTREHEATNMKTAQVGTYAPGSLSFFPVYYQNHLPNCNQFVC